MFTYTKPREALGDIETPMHLSYFLHRTLKHLHPKVILDPCCGRGNLLIPWIDRRACNKKMVYGIDTNGVLLRKAQERGLLYWGDFDFLNSNEPDFLGEKILRNMKRPELILCNPPWNRKEGDKCNVRNVPERFLRRIVELYGNEIPIAFLCPMGFRLNQRLISKRWRWLASKEAPKITSIISLPIDCFPKTQFHAEVLLFNCRGVKPHYFLDYLPTGKE